MILADFSLDIPAIAKIFGTGVALAVVVAVAFYTSAKVMRSDRTLDRLLESVEHERDYWKGEAQRERTAAEDAERRLTIKLDEQAREAAADRYRLHAEIETLRRVLHTFMLKHPGETLDGT